MTAEGILCEYRLHLATTQLKESTVKLYMSYAKAFIRNVFTGSRDINYRQVQDYVGVKRSRKENLSGLFSFMLDKGLVNFDKYRNEDGKSISTLIDNYLKDMRVRDRRESTVKSASSKLELLRLYLKKKDILSIHKVSKTLLTGFAVYLQVKEAPNKQGKLYDPSYRAQVLGRIKDFFRYLKASGEILYNPAVIIVIPKLPKRVYRNILSIDEINQLEQMINTKDMFGFRDLCIMETLYGTGIRAGEAANLTVEDLSLNDRTVLIRQGKGRKDRVVPINSYACRLLNHYLKKTRPAIIRKTESGLSLKKGSLFLNTYGKAIHKDRITRIIARYAARACLEKKVTAHTFRHSAASHMLAGGADIRYIQQFLGHDSLSSTQKYTKVVIEDLKETLAKYHPLESKDLEEDLEE